MKEIPLEERKALQFDILSKIDKICREKGFRYYLNSGTLLGAVRHKGYIPWDDDIDIAMPRPDYEAFYQYFRSENADSCMQLVSYRDKSSIYPFFKMIDPRTTVVEHYVDPKYQTGVWVDIFPLDGVKKGDDSAFKRNESVKAKYNLIIANPNNATTPLRKAIKKVVTPLFRRQDTYALAKQLDEELAATPISKNNDVAMAMWGYGPCERTPYSILETCELEFEGKLFFAPKQYDLYLSSLFGDYMTPPPIGQREAHFCSAYWKNNVD